MLLAWRGLVLSALVEDSRRRAMSVLPEKILVAADGSERPGSSDSLVHHAHCPVLVRKRGSVTLRCISPLRTGN
jgi:hypothetical protein